MANQNDKTIVVIGATGQQGKGVVKALKANTQFKVRAVTRNPSKYQGEADEVVSANLNDMDSLVSAFAGSYGVFVVTNFWEEGTDEISQAKNAIAAAKATDIQHFVWSTLPDVQQISSDEFKVPHFTDKAKVDELVAQANFPYYSFVVASFFYQNLITNMAPQALSDGSEGWVLPINANSKSIHMADIGELGGAVAGAFNHPEDAGRGEYLSVVGDQLSFNDIINTLKEHGHQYSYQEVPANVFADFFPGAEELAEMFGYFEKHTYLGDKLGAEDIRLEQKVAERVPTSFSDWVAKNWQ